MISLTMSRISSRALSRIELGRAAPGRSPRSARRRSCSWSGNNRPIRGARLRLGSPGSRQCGARRARHRRFDAAGAGRRPARRWPLAAARLPVPDAASRTCAASYPRAFRRPCRRPVNFDDERLEHAAPPRLLHLGASASSAAARSMKISAILPLGWISAIIWPLLAAVPNSCASNGMIADGSVSSALAKSAAGNFGPLRHAGHVQQDRGWWSLGRAALEGVEEVLGIAQSWRDRAPRRSRDRRRATRVRRVQAGPAVRHVEHDAGRRGAQNLDQRVEGRLVEVEGPVEHRRGGEQAADCRRISTTGDRPALRRAGRERTPPRRCPAAGPG